MKQKISIDVDFDYQYMKAEEFFVNWLSNEKAEGGRGVIEKNLGVSESDLVFKRKYIGVRIFDSFDIGEYYIVTEIELIHPYSHEVVGCYTYYVDENEEFVDEFWVYY